MNGQNPKTNNQLDDAPELTALLRELPRVTAPANFDAQLKARIAAAQSEAREFAPVQSLLRELPRVTVPGNFNAQLMARIAEAKAEAQEFAGVKELLQEIPRVVAPADFDFKLRARIAQAKSEEQKSPFSWLAEIFSFSFSWAQAGAALAVVALLVAGVTYNFMPAKNGAPSNTVTENEVAALTPSVTAEKQPSEKLAVKPNETVTAPLYRAKTATVAPAAVRSMAVANARSQTVTRVAVAPAPATENANLAMAGTVMIRHTKDGSARVINVSEYSLGQQAAFARNKVERPTPNDVATQIY